MTRIPVKQNRKGIPTPTPLHQGRRRHRKPEGKDSQLDSKIDSLEEKIRLIQGLNSFGNTDFSSMSWFPNMTVPPKFKAPEFEKYNGRGDPMIHLQMYCRKMAPYADNEPLLIQTFQDTLTGNAAEWYSQLKKISHLEGTGRHLPWLNTVGERIEDALKTKKIVDMTALMALAEQAAKKAPTKEEGRGCANDREKQWETEASPPNFHHAIGTTKAYSDPGSDSGSSPGPGTSRCRQGRWETNPMTTEKNLISPTIPRPYNGAPRKDFNQNLTCDFHFGEVGHAIGNCNHLRHRVQDLIDHGILKFEGLPNITTNPLPNHPEGGVNMVEIEEGNEERILWRRLFYTLEKKRHITPLEAPPGPSTGDACEYHSGARGHSLECCEEFKKKITNLMENGLVGREEIPSERSHQPEDPSDFDWYAELNLDDIVEDEMDLDNLQDEGADWGYFMEDDTDEWKDVDFTKLFQFTYLIVPPGFETPEFEIFYENGDPEVHLQKYGEKMALHLENELLMISVFPESLSKQAAAWFYQLRNLTGWDDLARVFLERYRFNPHSILEYLGLKEDEEPYVIPDPGVGEVIVEIKEEPSVLSLPALTEGEEEEEVKPLPPAKDPDNAPLPKKERSHQGPPPSNITTATC
uniref:Retrotransposon gag domain-containing protein n=1 Tax=Fagus sylvatica TaxID=28930 RepID=A0A2N9FKN6_FAGSY